MNYVKFMEILLYVYNFKRETSNIESVDISIVILHQIMNNIIEYDPPGSAKWIETRYYDYTGDITKYLNENKEEYDCFEYWVKSIGSEISKIEEKYSLCRKL